MYKRGLEHQRHCKERIKESHMIKHYFNTHVEEELEEIDFGI